MKLSRAIPLVIGAGVLLWGAKAMANTSTRETPESLAARFGISRDLAYAIISVANEARIADPVWLARLIRFESRFNPAAVNARTNATGLIQFLPSTAISLGTTVDALARMPALSQMHYVRAYFMQRFIQNKAPFRTELDTFMIVFYPAAIGKGPNYVFPAEVQSRNPGIRTAGDYLRYATRGSP